MRLHQAIVPLAILCLAFPHRAAAQATQPADDPNSDDAEVERRMLQLPPGFDIQLYASEPVLKRPPPHIGQCLAWDFDGPVVKRHRPQFAGWRSKHE